MKTSRSAMWTWCAGVLLAVSVGLLTQPAWGAYSGSGAFAQVTSRADLRDGYYVIVSSNAAKMAMVNTNAGTWFTNRAVTVSGSNTVNDPGTDIVWKFETNSTYGGISVFNEANSKYVVYAGTANAAYASNSVLSAGDVWSFAYASSVFSMANAASTARILQYNSSTPRFVCYSSAQTKLALFRKLDSAPSVTTVAASATNSTTATVNGNVTADGGATVTNRGACYKTSAGVTISDNKTAAAAGGTGTFSVDLSSLSVNQIYYFVAYAQNSIGTSLGSELTFTTHAAVPAAPTVNNSTASTLDVAVNENGNPSTTEFAIQCTNNSQYVQADGTLGATAVWATKSTWGTKTVTGLSASSTYGFQVKARNDVVHDETAFGAVANGTTAAGGAPSHWTALYNRGTPVYTYYLGDSLAYVYEFAINVDTAGMTVEYGLGKTAGGSGWTWRSAEWSRMDGSDNRVWKSKASEQQFTSTGSWYYAGRFVTSDPYTYYVATDWVNNSAGALTAESYFTVSDLTAPSGVSAAKDGTHSATRADLSWTQWNSKNVMITVATATPSGSPTQGHTYSASDTFGNQTVITGSTGDTTLEVTGLTPGQTYYFTFYSENYSYYSAGATAAALTMGMPQARTTFDVPGSIFLGDSGKTFGFDSWGQIEGNYGAARLWLRYNNSDLTGGTASDWSSFVNDDHKTRTSGVFNQTGTWYWGMQMDYGSPYGTNFWFKDSGPGSTWADMSSSGVGASGSNTVTVSAINDPASQTATVSGTLPLSAIDLSWAKNAQGNNVMVVRKLSSASWTEPTQGTAYSAGNTIGAGTVVYNGSDTSATASGLADNTTYDFKFYAVNNDYYSAGVTAQATTLTCAPSAPTGLYADPTNILSFTANWSATDRATGYRLDVSTSPTFSQGFELASIFRETMGTAPSTVTVAAHEAANGFDNDAYTMSNGGISKTGDVRNTSASAGYTDTVNNAASGLGNIYFTSTSGDYGFAIAGINASGYSHLLLSFGYRKESGSANASFAVEWATNGTWHAVTVSNMPAAAAAAGWYMISNLYLPPEACGSSLSLRWTKTGATAMRLDDVLLQGATPQDFFLTGYDNLAVAGTSASVTGLNPETTYYYRVRAEGEGGCPSANSGAASVTTLAKLSATVELFNLSAVYDGTPKAVLVTTDPDGLAVDVTYNGSGTAPTAAGDYDVVATVVDDTYQGMAQDTLSITKADQTIDFSNPGDQWSTNVVTLSATATSGLSVSFSVLSGPASISGGNTLTFTGGGSVSIVASQTGDGNWNAAPAVTNTFNVTVKTAPVIYDASINVREGGEGRFFVKLNQDPGRNVAVSIARSGGDDSVTIQSGAVRTFDSTCWNDWQAVTLTAATDGDADNETATFLVSLPDGGEQVVTATVLDGDIGSNLALASGGSTIAGTPELTSRAGQLIDGIHNVSTNYGYTIWTNDPKGTITLDLKAEATVSRIRLLNWDWVFRAHRYTVETSSDGENWTTLLDATGEDHVGWDDWPVANQVFRYLRFTGVSNTYNQCVLVSELEVYGTRSLSLPEPVLLKTDVNVREGGEGRIFVRLNAVPEHTVVVSASRTAGDASVTVQSGAALTFNATCWDVWQAVTLAAAADGDADEETATIKISTPGVADQYVTATVLDGDIGSNLALASSGSTIAGTPNLTSRAAQLIDGIHNVSTNYGYTIWTNSPQGTITLDLKAEATVSRIRLLNWDWVYRAHRYLVESSTDGTHWTTLLDATGEEHTGWDNWTVNNEVLRYLRFTGVSNTYNQCVVVSELEVYGTRDANLPQPVLLKTAVNVREGGEGRFFVKLSKAPDRGVAINISRFSGDSSITIQSGAVRTFDATCWDTWQAVTLAAPQDANATGETATFVVTMAGAADQYVTATTLDDDIAENLALATSGATATKARGSQPGALIDGVHTLNSNYGYTIWTNLAAPGTITVDLNVTATVSRVRLLNWDWVCRVNRYRLESSVDGSTWTPLADASGEDHAGWDDWAVPNQAIRYLRFTGLYSSYNQCVLVSELEVYGTRPVARRALKGSAIAESEPVSVLTSEGPADETGWAAVDGDEATAWTGQKVGGGYIVVEYQPALTLSALEVVMAKDSLTDVQYLYSTDAINWKPLPEDMEKNPVSLNFLWLVFPDNGTDAVPSVNEIRPNP